MEVTDKFQDKVTRLFKEDKIKIEKETFSKIFFRVVGDTDTYLVIYNKNNELWSCHCLSKSFWRINKPEHCTHIETSKLF